MYILMNNVSEHIPWWSIASFQDSHSRMCTWERG